MKRKEPSLSLQIADDLKEKIIVKKEYKIGDKLPNENLLSDELNVSRTTLREAIRILVTENILEIKRGKGTYIINDTIDNHDLGKLSNTVSDLKDLLELRLIIEPMAVYYATKRATKKDVENILHYGKNVEDKILNNEDRSEDELYFHNAIAKASHNAFIKDLMPIINEAINKGVHLSKEFHKINELTLRDHKMIMDFIKDRNADGAKVAMELHIINAMTVFGIQSK
ncbi:FadR/GntR family transcriptional regulator [Terrisporobacter petrolearius]|uniref:FadR/GntR family transcriptional regulator n=1 Tax=Terrisporobacter petrolearius TaxID=1460447 RepID=UPI0031CCD403